MIRARQNRVIPVIPGCDPLPLVVPALSRDDGVGLSKHTFPNTPSRSRGAFRPGCADRSAQVRAWGMPGAQCTRSLVCESGGWNAHEYSQRVHRKRPAFPHAVVYGLYRALPGDRAFLPPSPADRSTDLTPASGCQDHTVLPSASAPFVKSASASTASRPAFVTIAKRPSHRAGRRQFYTDLGFRKIRIFLQMGLDTALRGRRSDLPVVLFCRGPVARYCLRGGRRRTALSG
jgi:hypothetical protein